MPAPLPLEPLGIQFTDEAGSRAKIELFVDMSCPFAKKLFKVVNESIVSHCGSVGRGYVSFVAHLVPQVWHPQSCILNESVLGVKQVAGSSVAIQYMSALYDKFDDFGDAKVWDKSRGQIVEELIGIAASVGVDADQLRSKLVLKEGGGTLVSQDMKFAAKYHRRMAVHVTPTVFVNGTEAGQISSSWGVDEWQELLTPYLA